MEVEVTILMAKRWPEDLRPLLCLGDLYKSKPKPQYLVLVAYCDPNDVLEKLNWKKRGIALDHSDLSKVPSSLKPFDLIGLKKD